MSASPLSQIISRRARVLWSAYSAGVSGRLWVTSTVVSTTVTVYGGGLGWPTGGLLGSTPGGLPVPGGGLLIGPGGLSEFGGGGGGAPPPLLGGTVGGRYGSC